MPVSLVSFLIVSFALLTVGIVGLFDKSLYEPDVATVDKPKLIVFVVAVFVVNESPVSDEFFLIVIVELLTVGIDLFVPSDTSSNVKVISDDKGLLFIVRDVCT